MKAYTDLEQSKKLTEILPEESADHFHNIGHIHTDGPRYEFIEQKIKGDDTSAYWPCWSLAALLNVLPISIDEGKHRLALINSNPSGEIVLWLCCYEDDKGDMLMECYANNQVDACYEMILNLKEMNLL